MAVDCGSPCASPAKPTLLEDFSTSINALEDSLGRIYESTSYQVPPLPTGELRELGVCSKKLLDFQSLILRIDQVTSQLNRVATDLYKM